MIHFIDPSYLVDNRYSIFFKRKRGHIILFYMIYNIAAGYKNQGILLQDKINGERGDKEKKTDIK